MIQMITLMLIFILNLIFLSLKHPLAMGLMLLIQTTMSCLYIGMIYKTFWFSYMLFLIFLGGMLILFIYVTSLASNEMFSMSLTSFTFYYIIFFTIFMFIWILDKSYIISHIKNLEMEYISKMTMYFKENQLNMLNLYTYPTNMITLMLMIYLLVTLIAVVKITKMFYGPLRHMN
uniref:NADH-ubiquinone oxidoreductase chain 6 n=1 Tax=Chamaemyia juncorum TaxID=1979291 RepID=A0A1W5YKC8_9MUSC|nr:NADH dehydrogenase subunit 6 [Chamaemyia juncorum]